MSVETSSPRIVRLGKLSLKLDPNGAFAREITLDGEEIFRGIGFVARDANWGTPALPATVAVTASENRVVAETGGRLDQAAGDLEWRVAWTVTPTGVEARASFTSARGFPTNRTGFVVLHSLPAARGRSVRVAHPGGASEDTRFPDLISPHQPFFDIVALDYRTAAGHHVAIAFEGELFEIEDQRNWTDASYKTYCRPLARPYPYRIEPGETVEQVVRLTLAPADARARAPASAPKVVAQALMPLFGTHLPPGPVADGQAEALAALTLGFTAIEIALDEEGWHAQLAEKLEAAPGPVRLDLRKADPEILLESLRAIAPTLEGRRVVGVSLWDADDATVTAAREILPGSAIGAGTGSFFTELNRMTRWPAADYLAWTSNPTVHGFDDDTIGETTEVLADVLRSAKAMLPRRRFQIGPMTLGLRFNPNATTPEGRRASADPDPRQSGPIAAAWLAATAAGFIDEVVTTLSFFEPSGAKGLVDGAGRRTPSGHLLARLAALAGLDATILRWEAAPRAAGILIETPAGKALCIAQARHETAMLELPEGQWAQVEELTSDGFARRAGAPGRSVTLNGFAVTWVTEA